METLILPRRAMRPPAGLDDMPATCAWCSAPIGRREVFTRGSLPARNAGPAEVAIVCAVCLAPPQLGERWPKAVAGRGQIDDDRTVSPEAVRDLTRSDS
jgi:hypothetical protein